MPIFDNHIHFRPEGKGVEAAREFERAGGTALLVTHSPYEDIPIREASDYATAFQKTLAMATAIRKSTRLDVFVALGPYPVDLLGLTDVLGARRAMDTMRSGIDLAGRHIERQEAVAFGEVGRPHFPVAREVIAACNDLLGYTMEKARELGCAVVLHTEDPTPATFAELARIAAKAGLPPDRVVKHHSTPLTDPEDTHGLVPSILAKEVLVQRALEGSGPFLLETDYIDDPRRPGAVLGPATVPRKTRAWLASGLLSEEACAKVHKDVPERTYGIRLRN